MPERISITTLARSAAWSEIKRSLAINVQSGESNVRVELAACPTKIGGAIRYLVCPRCAKRRRALEVREGAVACPACHGIRTRHPDQKLSSGRLSRLVVRRARQVQRLDERLARQGPDRNTRRRWRRRRKKLLDQLAEELRYQQDKMALELSAIKSPPVAGSPPC